MFLTLFIVPLVVVLLRFRLFLGHADNDLRVLKKPPTSCLGIIQRIIQRLLTMFFAIFCSFMQSFQLQSSKVSKDYKRKVQFILNFDTIYFSYIYLTNLKNVPAKSQFGYKRVALPKRKPPTLLHGKPSCSHPSPALKVRTSNTTQISRYPFAQPNVCPRMSASLLLLDLYAIEILNI